MISISTIESNQNGNVIFEESPNMKFDTNTARVVNVPTLDGGSVVIHSGTSNTDRPVVLKGNISKLQADQLWDLFYGNSFFLLAHKIDLYLVSIKSMKTDAGKLEANIIIVNKEN